MNHFESFNKKQKAEYLEIAKKEFEASLKPLIGQLMQVLQGNNFDLHDAAIRALIRRSARMYATVVDEMGAEARHIEAEAAGEAWLKNLSSAAYEAIKTRNPSFKG